ncbi:MAG: hypothetical protein R3B45_06840 [Bdellovibrionota bacterium]
MTITSITKYILTFVSFAVIFIFQPACTTKKVEVEEATQVSNKSKQKLPSSDPITRAEEFIIDDQSAKPIYKKITEIEKKDGLKIDKDKLHTARGSASCKKDGIIVSCYYRVRSGKLEPLGSRIKFEKEITKKIWRYFLDVRPELKNESIITGDLICDYLGKKTPPYNIEKLTCKIIYPRLSNEAILVKDTAENIATLLRGNTPFKKSQDTVYGSILCQWIKGSNRSPCVIRPIIKGILQEKFIEVPGRDSGVIGPLLLRTVKDNLVHQKDITPKASDLPSEIMGSIMCNINSKYFLTLGKREAVCRISI